MAGVGKETARRWVREAFVEMREQGLSVAEVQASLGFVSSSMPAWDQARVRTGQDRHHLRRPAALETVFWSRVLAGASVELAARQAGVGRSTGYRWQRARFMALRQDGIAVRVAAGLVKTSLEAAGRWDSERRAAQQQQLQTERAALNAAVRASALHAHKLQQRRARPAADAREQQYWRLRGEGLNNFAACRVMGMDHHTGLRYRRRREQQAAEQGRLDRWSGRFLSLPERLQIADLLLLQTSMRTIAAQLGRSPSTISRELARHRDEYGQYQPHQADLAATQQRQRPRQPRLMQDRRLRAVVQRKLNRFWSPEQIAGWLRAIHPVDAHRRVCAETIYQALLVPGARCLNSRYTGKLRTGRRLRRAHALTRSHRGGAVKNMTMIADRPAEVDARLEPGHWEGDLIIGAGSTSAMITLRERVTHYGIIVNLPGDHTALTVNAALQQAFAQFPSHLVQTLTWDQGTEMARHHELAAATGLKIYFAERSSPWQRGANENFNGLARQFFPKNTDLSVHSHEHVNSITRLLNERPRKSLGFQTPASRFRTAARAA